MERRRTLTGPIAAAAWAGVVAGHWIAYLIAIPAANVRSATLAETGHGYWLAAMAAAFVLGVASAATTVVRGLVRGARRGPAGPPTGRYRDVAVRLALLQSAIFLVQEVLERAEVGAPLSGLAHDGFILVGIAAQIVVAALVALALTCLSRVSEVAGRVLFARPPARRRAAPCPTPRPRPLLGRPAERADRTRAPPALLLAKS